MKTAEQKAKDANVEKCVALMRSRADLGLKKYGKTTERTDLTPLEWVRHWQAENADATIYAEKLAQEIENLTAGNARLEAQLAERNEELEVLRKAVSEGGRFLLIAANRYASGAYHELQGGMTLAAAALGVELQWPKPIPHIDAMKARPQASLAPDPSSLTPSDTRWHDAQTTPPKVGHAVIGMVNGTTKTRAVYYVAKTGKWVDVNDRPVTVSQWRHL